MKHVSVYISEYVKSWTKWGNQSKILCAYLCLYACPQVAVIHRVGIFSICFIPSSTADFSNILGLQKGTRSFRLESCECHGHFFSLLFFLINLARSFFNYLSMQSNDGPFCFMLFESFNSGWRGSEKHQLASEMTISIELDQLCWRCQG